MRGRCLVNIEGVPYPYWWVRNTLPCMGHLNVTPDVSGR